MNFIEDNEIRRDVIRLDSTVVTSSNDEALSVKDISSNDEIRVEGYKFKVDQYIQALKLTIIRPDKRNSFEGRIDSIVGEDAYIDGNRVRLVKNTIIKGKRQHKTGYYNQKFKAVSELKAGDFADISGKFEDRALNADSFEVSPEDVTAADKAADTVDQAEYKKFYPDWSVKSKRVNLLGDPTPHGMIVNDIALQNYVDDLGQKLVPPHIKKKVHFIFIVVENDAVNTNMRANGLSYVYTGLLRSIDNEAQLAALMAHEIAHAIYEHVSKDAKDKQNALKNKGLIGDAAQGVIKFGDKLFKGKSKDEKKNEKDKESLKGTTGSIAAAAQNMMEKNLSTYSVDEEYQADRVGLCLMALAGYDPRQAPLIAKKLNQILGAATPVKNPTLTQKTKKELLADKKKDDTKKAEKKTDVEQVTDIANTFFTWQADDYKARSFATHPEDVKRFEALNRLIAMYWNGDAFIKDAKTGEKEYAVIKKKVEKKVAGKGKKK
ncbi:M48 family metalloprotease [Flavobacterium sp. 3HN19-14]|uniref:M48 family metalloprotease n=1 Tax=Flavobacterium sp. 3HN19-14 TaxID=3448133 RepID=UPI003EE361AB